MISSRFLLQACALSAITILAACSGSSTHSDISGGSIKNSKVSGYVSPQGAIETASKPAQKVRRRLTENDVSPSAESKQQRKKVYLGKASWICSPSGFGQKSSCFKRAS